MPHQGSWVGGGAGGYPSGSAEVCQQPAQALATMLNVAPARVAGPGEHLGATQLFECFT